MELFQFWQIVDNAWFELLKLGGFVLFLLLLGTLPYVDNMAHVGRYPPYITMLLLGTLPYINNMALVGNYISLLNILK